jgi:hypothetical protein
VLIRHTFEYSRTSARPLASAMGMTVRSGLAFAPTWRPTTTGIDTKAALPDDSPHRRAGA